MHLTKTTAEKHVSGSPLLRDCREGEPGQAGDAAAVVCGSEGPPLTAKVPVHLYGVERVERTAWRQFELGVR